MAEIEDNVRRSDAVQEMLGKTPPWIAKTGSIIVFMWLCILIGLGFWIRYPEIIEGSINITTQTPPAELVGRSTGRINLLVNNNDIVKKDQIIAYIKGSGSFDEIMHLNALMMFFDSLATDPLKIIQSIDSIPNLSNLGQVQNSYNSFVSKLHEYNIVYSLEKSKQLSDNTGEQIASLQRKEKLLIGKEKLYRQELAIMHENLKNDKHLFDRGHISKINYNESQSNYLISKRNLENNSQAMIENRQNLQNLQYSDSELILNDTEIKKTLNVDIKSAFNILYSELKTYKEDYFLIAPISGSVTFFEVWNNHQLVNKGDHVASIVVDSRDIIGKLQVNGQRFGKVKLGQKVKIKLNSFPMSEYGILIGKVSNISSVNRNDIYVIDVEMDPELITTYKKRIPFKHEMKGIGEIITADMSFIERVFYHTRKIGRKEFINLEKIDDGKK